MPKTVKIDVAAGEKPAPGEKFVIFRQENSEMLGLLDHGVQPPIIPVRVLLTHQRPDFRQILPRP